MQNYQSLHQQFDLTCVGDFPRTSKISRLPHTQTNGRPGAASLYRRVARLLHLDLLDVRLTISSRTRYSQLARGCYVGTTGSGPVVGFAALILAATNPPKGQMK